MTFGRWILDSGFWFLEFKSRFPPSLKSLDFELWALDLGLEVMDFASSGSGFGLWALDLRFWTSDFTPWTLEFGFQILDFRFLGDFTFGSRLPQSPKSKVLGLSTLDVGLWTSGFGLWTLDPGLWI